MAKLKSETFYNICIYSPKLWWSQLLQATLLSYLEHLHVTFVHILRVYFCVLACIGHWPRLLSRSVRVERGSRCDSWLRMNLSYEANSIEDSKEEDYFRIPSWTETLEKQHFMTPQHLIRNSQPLPNLQDPRQVGSSWQYLRSFLLPRQHNPFAKNGSPLSFWGAFFLIFEEFLSQLLTNITYTAPMKTPASGTVGWRKTPVFVCEVV